MNKEMREARKIRGWTHEDLRYQIFDKTGLNIPAVTLSQYETNHCSPPFNRKAAICLVLGIKFEKNKK